MRILSLVLATLLAAPLSAETPLSAEEFDRFTQGKTLYFGLNNAPYGVERYRENRRVTWSFLDGKCKEGEWYAAQDNQICFVYEDEPDTHCWQFFLDNGNLSARFGSDPAVVPLYQAEEEDDPMLCMGPDVGV